jgi:DNA-binding NarL/FixJ family response regulator
MDQPSRSTLGFETPPSPLLRVLVIERERFGREAVASALAVHVDLAVTHAGDHDEVDVPGEVDAALLIARTAAVDLGRTLRGLAHRYPRCRIVVLAGYADDVLVEAARRDGAIAVLDTSATVAECLAALWGRPGPSDEMPRTDEADRHALRRAVRLGLTARQHQVLRMLAAGKTPDQAARCLGIKLSTCRDHIKAMRQTLGVSSAVELVVVGSRLGILPELSRPVR